MGLSRWWFALPLLPAITSTCVHSTYIPKPVTPSQMWSEWQRRVDFDAPKDPRDWPPIPVPHVPRLAGQPAFSSPTTPNSYQLVPNWYIDNANSTGCASDFNDGQHAACGAGGQGPLLHWNELPARWGTYTLVLPNAVSVVEHLLSDDLPAAGTGDDARYLNVIAESGNQIPYEIQGDNLNPVCTGTLGTITSKNRAANQALSVTGITGCGGTLGFGSFVNNTTRNSFAWTANILGTVWTSGLLTQPCSAITNPLPTASVVCTEDDNWSTGDSVTITRPPGFRIAQMNVVLERLGSTSLPVVIYHAGNGGGQGQTNNDYNTANKPSHISGPITWVESSSSRFLTIENAGGFETRTGLFNSVTDDIFGGKASSLTFSAPNSLNSFNFKAGHIGPANLLFGSGSNMDGDIEFIGITTLISGQVTFGAVYNQSAGNVVGWGSGLLIAGTVLLKSIGTPGVGLYGPGPVTVWCSGTLAYTPGASSTFFDSGQLQIGQSTVACNGLPSTIFGASLTPQCNIPLNAANLAAATTQTIGGNTTLNNGSPNVAFASAVTLTSGQPMTFSTQAGVVYYAASAVAASTSATLTVNYSGSNTTTGVTTTTNTGFGDAAWVPGCGSIGKIGP